MQTETNAWKNLNAKGDAMEQMALRIAELTKCLNETIETLNTNTTLLKKNDELTIQNFVIMVDKIDKLEKKVNDIIDREIESISSTIIIIEEGQDEIIERLIDLETKFIKHEQTLDLHNDSNIKITDSFESEENKE